MSNIETSVHNVTSIAIQEPRHWTSAQSCTDREYWSQVIRFEQGRDQGLEVTLFTENEEAIFPTRRDVERAAERQGARARRETQQSMIYAGLQHTLLIIETVIEHNGVEAAATDCPFAPLFTMARWIYEADHIHADHLSEVAADLYRTASSYLDEATRHLDEGPEADLCYAFRAIANLVACDAPGHWLACAAAAAARADARSERS